MSNAFNPFAAPATAQPVATQPAGALPVYQAPAAPAFAPPAAAPQAQQPQRPVANSMNDSEQYDGYATPWFRHVPGEFELEITSYFGDRTEILGRACHIAFKVLASSNAEIEVGSEWRIAYKYDYERSERSDKDTYGADQRALGLFVQALYNQKVSAGFDARAAEQQLHKHDFKAQPGRVHLSANMGKPKTKIDPKTHAQTTRRYRNDLWMPARRVA